MYNRLGPASLLALALLGGLCVVASSSSALGQSLGHQDRFVDESEVYDMWMDWLHENGDYYPYVSAGEIWDAYQDGFFITYAWDGTRQNLNGLITYTNRFVWLGSYPVALIDWRGAVSFPQTFADMSSFEPSNVSTLVYSAWDAISASVHPVPTNTPANPGYRWYTSSPVSIRQPNGKLNRATVRMAFSNAPLGYITGEVLQGPVWYGARQDLYVTPYTYFDITGQWPSENEDNRVILMKETEWDALIDNASIRIKERWK